MSGENALKVRQIPHSAYLMKKLTVHSDANETTKRNGDFAVFNMSCLLSIEVIMRENELMMSRS